jgi:hypothetical protein
MCGKYWKGSSTDYRVHCRSTDYRVHCRNVCEIRANENDPSAYRRLSDIETYCLMKPES